MLCPNNPVQAGDDPNCGPVGRRADMGDARYNIIHWVEKPINGGYSGVAWFNVDHETARIVSSFVFLNATMLSSARSAPSVCRAEA